MVGGAGLQNWQRLSLWWFRLLQRVPCMPDSICGRCVWPCLVAPSRPSGNTSWAAKPRMGSQKSKQKSPRTVSRHPLCTSRIHPTSTITTASDPGCVVYLPFVHLTAQGGSHQKRVLWFEQRVSGCLTKSRDISATRHRRVGIGGAEQLLQRREKSE